MGLARFMWLSQDRMRPSGRFLFWISYLSTQPCKSTLRSIMSSSLGDQPTAETPAVHANWKDIDRHQSILGNWEQNRIESSFVSYFDYISEVGACCVSQSGVFFFARSAAACRPLRSPACSWSICRDATPRALRFHLNPPPSVSATARRSGTPPP